MAVYKIVRSSYGTGIVRLIKPVLYKGGDDTINGANYQTDINLDLNTYWIKYSNKENTLYSVPASRIGTFHSSNGNYTVLLKLKVNGESKEISYADICKDFQKYKDIIESEYQKDEINEALDKLPDHYVTMKTTYDK